MDTELVWLGVCSGVLIFIAGAAWGIHSTARSLIADRKQAIRAHCMIVEGEAYRLVKLDFSDDDGSDDDGPLGALEVAELYQSNRADAA